MQVPLYGFQEGDSIGLLIVADEKTTVRELAGMLQEAASLRVAPRPKVKVLHQGKTLDPEATIARSGLTAMERFDVVEDRG